MLYQILRTTLATQIIAELLAQSRSLCNKSLFGPWGIILPMIFNTMIALLLIIVRLWNTNIKYKFCPVNADFFLCSFTHREL